MKKSPLTYKTALILSLAIGLLSNLLFFIMYFYGRDAMAPEYRARIEIRINPTLVNIVCNFLLAFVLYMLNFKLLKANVSRRAQLPLIIVSTVLCALIISYVLSKLHMNLAEYIHGPARRFHRPERFIRGGFMRDTVIATIVMFSAQVIHLSHKQQQVSLENQKLLAENLRTRYQSLKNQVDPHFLFNSLNTLNALIKSNPDGAIEYVEQLSYVFRYTLQNKETIKLKEELKFTRSYCNLMQIRYGRNLKINYDIDERYNDCAVIPLSLQTLVENAIKHNVISNKQPLTINIAGNDDYTISVTNPMQPKKERESGEGIGLDNLAERCRLMWRREIVVNRSESVFEVRIPLAKG